MGFRDFIFLLAFITVTKAGPIDTVRDACAVSCTKTQKFGYKAGMSYEYNYEAKTTTHVKGASEGSASLLLTAKVHIEVISNCDYLLRIDNTQLREADPSANDNLILSEGSDELRTLLERNNLMFAFQDGVIEQLCPTSGESHQALNIKRGILSVLQNSMTDLNNNQRIKEIDVSGNCMTEYSVVDNNGYSKIIKKTKDILSCTERHDYTSSISGVPYSSPSNFQSLPLLKSDHNCQHDISNKGVLASATCLESHVFRPFSREESGAVTQSRQVLTFVTQRTTTASVGSIGRRTNLLFEHHHDSSTATNINDDINRKLTEICHNTQETRRPKLFTELVGIMKKMDVVSLKAVDQQILQQTICSVNSRGLRKFFLDAIPMVETEGSVRLLTELISDKTVSGIEANMWLTSLSLIKYPTKQMLKEVQPLVRGDVDSAMLGVASLVHSFCQHNTCEGDGDVRDIVNDIQSKIGQDCMVEDSTLKKVLISLRSLGNSGQAAEVITTINNCLTRKDNPMEVRLAAAEAFRRASCSVDRFELLSVFMNRDEDPELRIAAYLSLMTCADRFLLVEVKSTLETEVVNQVGSFVWSHLTNLMETSNPLKQSIRNIIENEKLRKDFELDKSKYSRNYEWSAFQDKLNIGGSVESNLIWSPASFIPRSASANFTVDLFGHSVNLLEIGGRMKGLDRFLESYFGPNGYFGGNKKKQPMHKLHVNDMHGFKFISPVDDLSGHLYLRVFGNELGFKMFGTKEPSIGDDNFNLLQMLIAFSKNNDYSFSKNLMFLDASMIFPTSSGFPMSLKVNGAASIDLNLSGQLDLRKVAVSPRSLLIRGEIKPSATVQISGTMSVDGFVTKSGLKIVSTLHSSTLLKGRLEIQNGRIFNSEIDVPNEKMELLTYNSDFFIIHKEKETKQNMITENKVRKQICTGSELARIVGIEVCGEVSFPNASLKTDAPYFPMTGPVSVGVELLKRDTHTQYKWDAQFTTSKQRNILRMGFDTPNSRVDRKMDIDFTLDKVQKTLNMALISPWQKAILTGSMTNNDNIKRFDGNFLVDNETELSVLAEVRISRKGNSYILMPKAEVMYRQWLSPISLLGAIEFNHLRLLDVNFNLNGLTEQPITAKGVIMSKKSAKLIEGSVSFEKSREYSFTSRLQTSVSKKSYTLKPFLSIRSPDRELIGFGGRILSRSNKFILVDLSLSKITNKDIMVFARFRKHPSRLRYQTNLSIRTPFIITKFMSNVGARGTNNALVRMSLDYIIPGVSKDRVTVNGKVYRASTRSLKKFKGHLKLTSKANPRFNFGFLVDANSNQKRSDIDVSLRYGTYESDKEKIVSFSTALTHQISSKRPNLALTSTFEWPEFGINIHSNGNHSQDDKQVSTSLEISSADRNVISTNFVVKENNYKKSTNFRIAYPGREVQLWNEYVNKYPKEISNTFSLQYEPGTKNTIKASLLHPSKSQSGVSVDVILNSLPRVQMLGQISLDKSEKMVKSALSLGKKKYLFMTHTQASGRKTTFYSDVEWPSRRVVLDAETNTALSPYIGKMDLKWDALNDVNKRFVIDCKADIDNINNVQVSVKHTSPMADIKVDVSHRLGASYVSNVNITWGEDKKVTIDTTFSNRVDNVQRHLLGQIKVTSPFRKIRDIHMDFMHQSNAKTRRSRVNIDWKPWKPYSLDIKMLKPKSWTSFESTIALKTPLKYAQTVTFDLSYSFERELKIIAKSSQNKKFISLIVNGMDKGSDVYPDIIGSFQLKTAYRSAKSIYINARHATGPAKYQTSISLERNRKGINNAFEMTHSRIGWQIQNNLKLLISVPPYDTLSVDCHLDTDAAVNFSLSTGLGEHSSQLIIWTTMESRSVSSSIAFKSSFFPDANLEFKHKYGHGNMNSSLFVLKGNRQIFSVQNQYEQMDGHFMVEHVTKTAGNQYTFELDSHIQDNDYNGKMNFQWTKNRKFGISGNLSTTDNLMHGIMNFNLPVKHYKDVVLSLNQKLHEHVLVTTTSLQYQPGRVIAIENRYQWDDVKHVYITMKTPLTSIRLFKAGAEFSEINETFSFSSDFEATPLFSKISVISKLNTNKGINGHVIVRTPYASFRNTQIGVTSTFEDGIRYNKLLLGYSPTKQIRLQSSYAFQKTSTSASVSLSSPFQFLQHVGASANVTTTSDMFLSHLRVELSKRKIYEAKGKFLNQETTRNGVLTLTSPHFDDVIASFSHTGLARVYATHGELQYRARRKIEVDTVVTLNDRYDGKLIIKTPFSKEIKANVYISRSIHEFETRAQMQYGKKSSEVSINVSTGNICHVSTIVDIPIFNRISAWFNHTGSFKQFQSKGVIEYGLEKRIVSTMSFRNNVKTKGSVRITTPFSRPFAASFDHIGDIRDFQTIFQIEGKGQKQLALDTAFTCKGKIEGSIHLRTPFSDDILATVHHSRSTKSLRSQVMVQYRTGQKFDISLGFKTGKQTDGTIELQTPFTEQFGASFYKVINTKNTIYHAETQYAARKVHEFDLLYRKVNKYVLSVSTQTPYWMGGFTYGKEDSQMNIRSHLQLPSNRKYEIDIQFAALRQAKALFILKTPHWSMIKLVIGHRVHRSSSKTTANLLYGQNIKINSEINVRTKPIRELSINVITPFKGYNKLKFSLRQKVSLKSFLVKALMSRGKIAVSSTLIFRRKPVLLGEIVILTPIPGYKRLKASFKHNVTLSAFHTRADITYGKNKDLVGDVLVDTNPYTIATTIETPFKGFESRSFLLAHEKTSAATRSICEISVTRRKKIVLTSTIDRSAGVDAEVTVQSPYSGYENVVLTFYHSGTIRKFESRSALTSGRKKLGYHIVFDSDEFGSLTGSVTVELPIRKYRDNTLTFSFDGTQNNFRTYIQLGFMGRKSDLDLTFSTLNNIETLLIVTSPYCSPLKASTLYANKGKNINVQANALYGENQLLDGQVTVSFRKRLSISANFQTLWTKSTDILYVQEGSITKFHSKVRFMYGSSKSVMEARFDSTENIAGYLSIDTPYEHLQSFTISTSVSTYASRWKGLTALSINGKSLETGIKLYLVKGFEGSVSLKSQFAKIPDMNAMLSIKKYSAKIEINNDGELILGDVTYSTETGQSFHIGLVTPWTYDFDAALEEIRMAGRFSSSMVIKYKKLKHVSANIDLDIEASVPVNVKILTPYPPLDNVRITVQQNGSLSDDFDVKGEIIISDVTYASEINLQMKNNVNAVVSIAAPGIQDLLISLRQSGEIMSMTTSAEVNYNNIKTFGLKSSWDLLSQFDISAILQTPFDGFENVHARIGMSENEDIIKANASIGYYRDQTFSVNVNIDKKEHFEGLMNIRSPYSRDIQVVISYRGSKPFLSTISIMLDGQEKFHTETSVSVNDGMSMTLKVRSGLQFLRNVNVGFDFNHDLNSFIAKAKSSINDDMYTVEMALSNAVSKHLLFSLDSPYADTISTAFIFQPANATLPENIKEYYGKLQKYRDMDIDFENSLHGYLKIKNIMSLFVENTNLVEGLFFHSSDQESRSYAEVSYAMSKYTTDITWTEDKGKVTVTTPIKGYEELYSAYSRNFTQTGEVANAAIQYRSGEKIEIKVTSTNGDMNEVAFAIKTPYDAYKKINILTRNRQQDNGAFYYLQATQNDNQIALAEITYQMSPHIHSSIVLVTPMTGFENVSVITTYKSSHDELSFNCNLTNEKRQILEGDIVYKTANGVFGGFSLKTMSKNIREVSASFDYNDSVQSLAAECKGIGKPLGITEFKLHLNWDQALRGGISLLSPLIPNEKAALSFSNSLLDGRLKQSLQLENKHLNKFSLDVISVKPYSIHLTLRSQIPGYEHVALKGSFDSSSNISSSLELTLNQHWVTGDITMYNFPTNEFSILMNINSSVSESMSSRLRHTGTIFNYETSLEIFQPTRHLFKAASSFSSDREMRGSFAFLSPLTAAQEMSFNFTKYNLHAEYSYETNGENIVSDISLVISDDLEATLSIQTPFTNYENITAILLVENAKINEFDLHYSFTRNDKHIEGEIHFVIKGGSISSAFTVNTPFDNYKSMSVNFDGHGNLLNADIVTRVVCNHDNVLSFKLKHVIDGLRMDHSITTSSIYFPTTSIAIYHNGHFKSFSSSMALTYGPDSMIHNIISKTDIGNIMLDYNTVTMIDDIRYTSRTGLTHEGNLEDFKTKVINEMNGRRNILFDVAFKISAVTEGLLIIRTPLKQMRNLNIAFDHTGDLSQFKTKLAVKYGKKTTRVTVDVFRQMWNRLNANFKLDTPFQGYEQMVYIARYNVNSKGVTGMIDLQYGLDEKVKLSMKTSYHPLSFETYAETPFVGYTDMALRAKHIENENGQNFDVLLKYSTDEEIKIRTSIQNKPKVMSFTILTPFEGYESSEFTYSHDGNYRSFTGNVEFHASYMQSTSVSLVHELSSPSEMSIQFSLVSPMEGFEMIHFKLRNQKNDNDFFSHSEVSWSVTDKIALDCALNTRKSIMIRLNTPFQTVRSASFGALVSENGRHSEISTQCNTKGENFVYQLITEQGHGKSFVKIVRMNTTVEIVCSFAESESLSMMSGNIVLDSKRIVGVDWESGNQVHSFTRTASVHLPTRSFRIHGLKEETGAGQRLEGAFHWDAERDDSKVVGFEVSVVPDVVESHTNLLVNIGKEITLVSKTSFMKDAIYFDTKTELKYSNDSSKNVIIQSFVKDASFVSGRNVSFMFGLTHVFSTIDFQFESSFASENGKYSTDFITYYMTSQLHRHLYRARGEFDVVGKSINANIDSPVMSGGLIAGVIVSNGYKLFMNHTRFDRPTSALLSLNAFESDFNLNANYTISDIETRFHMIARYPNTSALEAKMYHSNDDVEVTDGSLTVQLDSPQRLLHTHIYWRPSLLTDVKNACINFIDKSTIALDSSVREVTDLIEKELMFKYNAVRREFIGKELLVLESLKRAIENLRESVVLAQQYKPLDTYMHSDVLLEDLIRYSSDAVIQFDILSKKLSSYQDLQVDFPMKDKYDNGVENMIKAIQIANDANQVQLRRMLDNADAMVQTVFGSMINGIIALREHLSEIVLYASNPETVGQIESRYARYVENTVLEPLSEFMTGVKDSLNGAEEKINIHIPTLLQGSGRGFVKAHANNMLQLGSAAYKYWEIEENMKSVGEKALEIVNEIITDEIEVLTKGLSHVNSSTIVFDPDHGQLKMVTYVPAALPQVDIQRYYQTLKSYILDFKRISNFSLALDEKLFTPFEASAAVLGTKFVTFDGKAFIVSERCSYILSQDFIDGNFSVVLQSADVQHRKWIIFTAGKYVQLLPNGNVRVGKRLVDTPYHSSGLIIKKSEGNVMTVKSRDITVILDRENDSFHLTLSRWYHGKIGGLLGNLDNEKYNDVMSSSNRLALDVTEFSKSWRWDGECFS